MVAASCPPGCGLAGPRERGQVARAGVPQHLPGQVRPDLAGAQRLGQHPSDVGPAQPQRVGPGGVTGQGVADDDADPVPVQAGAAGEAGRGERPGGGLQGQPVGRVGGGARRGRDAEGIPVELPALDEAGPGAVVGRGGFCSTPSPSRHRPDRWSGVARRRRRRPRCRSRPGRGGPAAGGGTPAARSGPCRAASPGHRHRGSGMPGRRRRRRARRRAPDAAASSATARPARPAAAP